MSGPMEQGGFPATASPAVAPLAPYRSSVNAQAIHDAVFGLPATGSPGQPGYLRATLGGYDAYKSGLNTTDQNYLLWRAAVAARIIADTPTGLETLLGVVGDGPTKAPVDFWQWYETYLTGGTYNGIPAGSPGSLAGAGIINPVTKQFIPQALIAPGYPQTDKNGTTTLLLTDGRKWTYFGAHPGTVNPSTTAAFRTGVIDTEVILNVSNINPQSPLNAVRGIVHFSDGSTSDDPDTGHPRPENTGRHRWAITTDTPAQLTAKYGGPPLRITSTREWSALSQAEQIAVGADINLSNGWNPATVVNQPTISIYSSASAPQIAAPIPPSSSLPTGGILGVIAVTHVDAPMLDIGPATPPAVVAAAAPPNPIAAIGALKWLLIIAAAGVLLVLLNARRK